MATTPTLQQASQFHRDWGVYQTANVLPNAPGNPIGNPEHLKLAQGQTAFVAGTLQWAVCASPGTPGGGNAVWTLFTSGAGANNFIQSATAQVAVDVSNGSGAYVDLLTIPLVTTGGSKLHALFTCSTANNFFFGAQNEFIYTIDGITQHATAAFLGGATITQSCSLSDTDTLAAGAHTFKIRWRVTAGTGFIRPVSAPNLEHATFTIYETLT